MKRLISVQPPAIDVLSTVPLPLRTIGTFAPLFTFY